MLYAYELGINKKYNCGFTNFESLSLCLILKKLIKIRNFENNGFIETLTTELLNNMKIHSVNHLNKIKV